MNKNISVVVIILLSILLSLPYIIASNSGESGIIIKNKEIDSSSLPIDIQDILLYKGTYNLLLIEDPINKVIKDGEVSKQKKLVLSRQNQAIGSFVKINDIFYNIYVSNDIMPDMNEQFDKLIIGDADKPIFAGIMESIINNGLSPIISLSKLIFYISGLFVVFFISFLYYGKIKLWNIPAILSFYSFEAFIVNLISIMNKIEIDSIYFGFGFMFLITIPFIYIIKRYESTEKGRYKIRGFYELHISLIKKIIDKFKSL